MDAVNCGRCAHLASIARMGHGICGSAARREVTNEINPSVDLSYTCEFGKLSAKYDPDFIPIWKRNDALPKPPAKPDPAPQPAPVAPRQHPNDLFDF